jgi:hypothetical protein
MPAPLAAAPSHVNITLSPSATEVAPTEAAPKAGVLPAALKAPKAGVMPTSPKAKLPVEFACMTAQHQSSIASTQAWHTALVSKRNVGLHGFITCTVLARTTCPDRMLPRHVRHPFAISSNVLCMHGLHAWPSCARLQHIIWQLCFGNCTTVVLVTAAHPQHRVTKQPPCRLLGPV